MSKKAKNIKKNRAFTLIELLSVIVVLGVLFLYITPKLSSLIKMGGKTETELIEERVLRAAREYANDYNPSFYDRLINEGDTNYIFKSDLLKLGLIDNDEVSKLDNFVAVKGELLANDKIKYTVQYLDNSESDYLTDELYQMIQDLNNRLTVMNYTVSSHTSSIETLNDQTNTQTSTIDSLGDRVTTNSASINSVSDRVTTNSASITGINSSISTINSTITALTNKSNANNVFLKTYPVGSTYITSTNTNPGTFLGGTWTLVDKEFSLLSEVTSTTDALAKYFTVNTTNAVADGSSILVNRKDHMVYVRLRVKNNVILNDNTIELGTFKYSGLGFTRLAQTIIDYPSGSDGGNGIALISVAYNTGSTNSVEVITKASNGTIAAGSIIIFDYTFQIFNHTWMNDSACDKFYWKRTA